MSWNRGQGDQGDVGWSFCLCESQTREACEESRWQKVAEDLLAYVNSVVVEHSKMVNAVDSLQLRQSESSQGHSASDEPLSVLEASCVEDHLDVVAECQDEVELRVVVYDSHVLKRGERGLPPRQAADAIDFVDVLLVELDKRVLQESALTADDTNFDLEAGVVLRILGPIEERNSFPNICFGVDLVEDILDFQEIALIDEKLPREGFDLLLARENELFNILVLLHQD